MFLTYTHNEGEQWQQINTASQRGVLGCYPPKAIHYTEKNCTIKINDLKKLCSSIPEYRSFYRTLQTTEPYPHKLHKKEG